MNKKIILTAFLTLFALIGLKAQEESSIHNAPSLQLGLNGLTFSKGDLDAQLIMEIIAEKQQEIKVRLVENMFLDGLDNTGGTVYNYATNILKGVTKEPNPETRTRIVLENTVNLVFVYAFAEYMMMKNSSEINKLADLYYLSNKTDFREVKFDKTKINTADIEKLKSNPKKENRILGSYNSNLVKDDFVAFILDISSEAIRRNPKLKELGLMQVTYTPAYEFKNRYLQEKREKTSIYIKAADGIYQLMEQELSKLDDIVGLANYYFNELSLISNIRPFDSSKFQKNDSKIDLNSILELINETEININAKWTIETDSLLTVALSDLSQIRNLIKKVQRVEKIDDSNRFKSDLIFLFNNQVIPTLRKYSKFNPNINPEIDILVDSVFDMASKLLSDSDIFNRLNDKKLTKILGLLYKFNESRTYLEFINMISDFESIFDNQIIKSTLSILNTYVTNNVAIHKNPEGERYIDFNIESFLTTLSKTNENKLRAFQFHFTVGVNNAYFISPLYLNNGESINNYSFVSEKIGIKYKLYNPGAWKNRNYGELYRNRWGNLMKKTSTPKEPLISNWHLLLYGSGILYNITPTGTSKEFNFPIVGFGTGLTFYNSLDLNFTIGVPVNNSLNFSQNFSISRCFLGLGFDIQFTEYINRLAQKRKNNQTQKRLAN